MVTRLVQWLAVGRDIGGGPPLRARYFHFLQPPCCVFVTAVTFSHLFTQRRFIVCDHCSIVAL